jgi:hypothetical protein
MKPVFCPFTWAHLQRSLIISGIINDTQNERDRVRQKCDYLREPGRGVGPFIIDINEELTYFSTRAPAAPGCSRRYFAATSDSNPAFPRIGRRAEKSDTRFFTLRNDWMRSVRMSCHRRIPLGTIELPCHSVPAPTRHHGTPYSSPPHVAKEVGYSNTMFVCLHQHRQTCPEGQLQRIQSYE